MNPAGKDPFIVSRETCGDCVFFGYITGDTGRVDCCDYVWRMCRLRPKGGTCADCSVKIPIKKEKDQSMSEKQFTVNQRMRRLGLGIGSLCMEMEKRGRMVRYCEVAAAFHGQTAWNEDAQKAILKTLDELEAERNG